MPFPCLIHPFLLVFVLLHMAAAIKITGASGGHNATTGSRPIRLEINDFAQSGPAFDLYIQALDRLQRTDQADPLSYFQIAGEISTVQDCEEADREGIHGFPMISWDGVNGSNPLYPGFCTHGAAAFPTWHRPYLALIEQVLWIKAQAIAQTYPADLRSTYEAAALSLRIPFWDWGVRAALPAVVRDSSIIINTPSGRTVVENPLYDYNFQWDAERNGFPRDRVALADLPYTVRHWDATTKQSNQSAADAELSANAGQIMSSTYRLFTELNDYTSFSCVAPGGVANTGNNIEIIHGNIHNFVGGKGHMLWPELSAFDPIFWLHHTNVDRLFAMWQVLNPDSYIVPTLNSYGTFYKPPGSIDSGNSSLAPFHSDNGTRLFTNDDVRAIAAFNYAYPDIPDWTLNATQLAGYVRTQVNLKYNPLAQPRRSKSYEQSPISILAAFSQVGPDEVRRLGVNNAEVQWTIKVVTDRYAYSTAFSLLFFMGPPPTDIRSWPTAPNLVGTQSQFIASDVKSQFPGGAPKGFSQGEIPLTHTVLAGVDRGFLSDLSPSSVVPVLRDALTWRARTPDGSDVDLTQLSGLSIAVGSMRTVPTTRRDRFPTYDPVIWHPEATGGKVGGAGLVRMVESRQS